MLICNHTGTATMSGSTAQGRNYFMEFLKLISDSGNPLVSKIITYAGVGIGVGGGAAQGIARSSHNEIIQACADMSPDWLAYAPAVVVTSLVIKNASDWHFRRIEVKLKVEEAKNNGNTSTVE